MVPKFRFFDTEENKMHVVDSLYTFKSLGGKDITIATEDIDVSEWRSYSDGVLMQSTGLKDRNGVDIFYDDIVKVSYKEHSYLSYITHEFNETTIEEKYIPRDFHYYENPLCVIFGDDYDEHNIEVVGNIHEHPYLLGSDDE